VTSETASGGTAQTVEIDDALASLAVARLGSDEELEEVLNAAMTPTSVGGLVIAIVTDRDEGFLERIAALRHPGGTGLLFLLDTTSFGRGRPGPPADQTVAHAAIFGNAGWSTCIVDSGVTVAQAWDTVTSPSAVIAGDRP
jgi:hypothetical protein